MDLCGEEIRGYLVNRGYAGGVLGSQGGYGACGKDAVYRHCFDICLDSGAAAGIAAGYRKNCFHGDPPYGDIFGSARWLLPVPLIILLHNF